MGSKIPIDYKHCDTKNPEPCPKKVKLKKDKGEIEENRFHNLFTAVLDYFIEKEKINETEISNAIKAIIKSFHSKKGNKFSDVNYEETKNMCGYLFRYGSHGAGLARNKVLNAIKHCNVLKDCFKKAELNIISLGGAFGNDIIGLCSALYEVQVCNTLSLTVVDRIRRWGSCLSLIEFFLREGTYGNVSQIFRHRVANCLFIPVTLPGKPETDLKYFKSLKEADIILIQKLMSVLGYNEKKGIIKVSLREVF